MSCWACRAIREGTGKSALLTLTVISLWGVANDMQQHQQQTGTSTSNTAARTPTGSCSSSINNKNKR